MSDPIGNRSQPESFRARAFMPSFTVKDLNASLRWYDEIVDFTVVDRYEHEGKLVAARLVAGDVSLLLNQDNGAKGWDRSKGVGCSFTLVTVQDVDELARLIQERGGTLDSEPADMPWGARVFRLRDPDGFQFSISSAIDT